MIHGSQKLRVKVWTDSWLHVFILKIEVIKLLFATAELWVVLQILCVRSIAVNQALETVRDFEEVGSRMDGKYSGQLEVNFQGQLREHFLSYFSTCSLSLLYLYFQIGDLVIWYLLQITYQIPRVKQSRCQSLDYPEN